MHDQGVENKNINLITIGSMVANYDYFNCGIMLLLYCINNNYNYISDHYFSVNIDSL